MRLSLFILLAALASCAGDSSSSIRLQGTVHYDPIEGGCWGIDGDDGTRYDPMNLDAGLRLEGLRVAFTGRLRTDMGHVCPGEIIELQSVTALQSQ